MQKRSTYFKLSSQEGRWKEMCSPIQHTKHRLNSGYFFLEAAVEQQNGPVKATQKAFTWLKCGQLLAMWLIITQSTKFSQRCLVYIGNYAKAVILKVNHYKLQLLCKVNTGGRLFKKLTHDSRNTWNHFQENILNTILS